MNKNKETALKVFLSCLSMSFLIYIGTTIGQKARLDLTEDGMYSLSEGSKNILKKLNRPIRLKLYYSKTAANKGAEGIRAFNNYYIYVRDLLEEYVGNSRNNISLEIIDPRPDTRDEEDALAYGLKKFQLTETERYFFGLVAINQAGTEKIIEFFDPNRQESLEYDVTKLIYSVNDPTKKTIGIISSIPILQDEVTPYMAQLMRMQGRAPQESWIITQLMQDLYKLKNVKPEKGKISGVDTLLVVHPQNLDKETLFAIDQFVVSGGRMLLLVDAHSVATPGLGMGGAKGNSELNSLTKKWGVTIESGKFVGDKYLSGIGRTGPNAAPTRMLPLLNCDKRCVDSYRDPITAGTENLIFLLPGSLVKNESVKDIIVTPFLGTTEKGNSYVAAPFQLSQPQLLWNAFEEGSEPAFIGYKMIGKFESNFPDGVEIERKEGEKTKKMKLEALATSEKEGAVVVISDVDFISDSYSFKRNIFGVSLANENSTVFLNALEILSGNTDLVSVRSKGKFNRSFDVIDNIEMEAEKKTEAKISQINGSIVRFQQELASLGQQADQSNLKLIQNEGVKKKKELVKKIALLKGELREVKREGREKVESIGKFLQYINTLLAPILVLVLGLYFNFYHKHFRSE